MVGLPDVNPQHLSDPKPKEVEMLFKDLEPGNKFIFRSFDEEYVPVFMKLLDNTLILEGSDGHYVNAVHGRSGSAQSVNDDAEVIRLE
jgi:hypothetical protein